MDGAVDAKRDRDRQRDERGENIDIDRVEHARRQDVGHVGLVDLGIAEIALQHAVEFAVDIRPEADPAQIPHDQRVVETHLLPQHLVPLLILGRFQRCFHRFELGSRRVGWDQVVDGIHQKRDEQEHDHHVQQSLEYVFGHPHTLLFFRICFKMKRKNSISNRKRSLFVRKIDEIWYAKGKKNH